MLVVNLFMLLEISSSSVDANRRVWIILHLYSLSFAIKMTSSILLKKKYCLLGTQCLKSRGGRRRQEHCKLFRDFEKIAGLKSQVKSMLCSSAQHQVPQNLKLHAHAEVYTQCFWHRRAGGVLIFKWVQLLDKSLQFDAYITRKNLFISWP